MNVLLDRDGIIPFQGLHVWTINRMYLFSLSMCDSYVYCGHILLPLMVM